MLVGKEICQLEKKCRLEEKFAGWTLFLSVEIVVLSVGENEFVGWKKELVGRGKNVGWKKIVGWKIVVLVGIFLVGQKKGFVGSKELLCWKIVSLVGFFFRRSEKKFWSFEKKKFGWTKKIDGWNKRFGLLA